jgi:hypothetical protein
VPHPTTSAVTLSPLPAVASTVHGRRNSTRPTVASASRSSTDADRDFQRFCLGLLADAVAAGQADPSHLALLTDRVRVAEGRPQVYGIQYYKLESGEFGPSPNMSTRDVTRWLWNRSLTTTGVCANFTVDRFGCSPAEGR